MKRFKSIILVMQGKSKSNLHWLYHTRSVEESPLVFDYASLKFWFSGTGYRSSEKLLLYVSIPNSLINISLQNNGSNVAVESCLLHLIAPAINLLASSYQNQDKNVREKAQFEAQSVGCTMARRSGLVYDVATGCFVLRLNFNVPLVNALSVNAKAAIAAVRDILDQILDVLSGLDRTVLERYLRTWNQQEEIRRYMREHSLCAFLANGSILPREDDTDHPMPGAIPFQAPEELLVSIRLEDGSVVEGMGIPAGVTVITGGGYSGKSTLLDALEMGIYNHIPGDGREFVLAENSALRTDAEDGRPVSNLDLSPFFHFLPGKELSDFSTAHASGSVSQAANILEAVCGRTKLLLIDEDKSAANFMLRDEHMRMIVQNEPIIPFTDRVRELSRDRQVSTVLVIGSSSEYLSYADHVILMEGYLPHVITNQIHALQKPHPERTEKPANWPTSRRLVSARTTQEFLYVRHVETEKEKKIILDEHVADITHLTAIRNGNQMNLLSFLCEKLLCLQDAQDKELLELAEIYIEMAFCGQEKTAYGEATHGETIYGETTHGETAHDESEHTEVKHGEAEHGEAVQGKEKQGVAQQDMVGLLPEAAQRFYEEIRPVELYNCLNRMRGLHFTGGGKACDE